MRNMENNKLKKEALSILKNNQQIIYFIAKMTILLIFFGILFLPTLLKSLLTNPMNLVVILFFNISLCILIFFNLLEEKQKDITHLIGNYFFLTISIILCYGIFYYIDEKIIEQNALKNVWNKTLDIEREVFYFSGVTYFTIGYGDIIPVKPYAQVAALSEAFLGAIINLIVIGMALKKIR